MNSLSNCPEDETSALIREPFAGVVANGGVDANCELSFPIRPGNRQFCNSRAGVSLQRKSRTKKNCQPYDQWICSGGSRFHVCNYPSLTDPRHFSAHRCDARGCFFFFSPLLTWLQIQSTVRESLLKVVEWNIHKYESLRNWVDTKLVDCYGWVAFKPSEETWMEIYSVPAEYASFPQISVQLCLSMKVRYVQ